MVHDGSLVNWIRWLSQRAVVHVESLVIWIRYQKILHAFFAENQPKD